VAIIPPPATAEDKLNWEVEKLRKEVRNLSITFVTGVVLALVGVATGGYNVVKAFTDVSVFQEERIRLGKEVDALKQERDVATAQLSNFRAAVSDLQANTSLTAQQKLDSIQDIEPTLQYSAPDQAAHSTLPARIYIQYLTSEKSYADGVIAQLANANYKVNPLGVESTSRARIPTVGYYHAEDAQQAQDLVALLKRIGVPKVREQAIRLKGAARPRHFDVWLPKNDA
jgi:cell division protein FtsB